MNQIKAIYPGTFDPLTNGHLDVLQRACKIFDEVVMVVANNRAKGPLFTLQERISLIEESLKQEGFSNASVQGMEHTLTVDFARQLGAKAIVRGLRAVSDFEFEFQMAQMNRNLDDEIETVFLMPNDTYFYTSSNLIKHVSRYTQDRIAKLVPVPVQKALNNKMKEQQED